MPTELTNVKNNWVYQPNRVIEARYSLTTNEQKMVRLIASMVRQTDESFIEYTFPVVELAKILGINTKNAYRELVKISENLMSRYIRIKYGPGDKDWSMHHLIQNADCRNGIYTIRLHDEMKEFYLNLQEVTKYTLQNVIEFKCSYSFRLYELMKENEQLGTWYIDIEYLKMLIETKKNEYKQYGHFKSRVVIPAQKEINEKTDIMFVFEEVKNGKKVIGLRFSIFAKQKVNSEDIPENKEEYRSEFTITK